MSILCPLCGGESEILDGSESETKVARCSNCSNTFDPEGVLEAPSGRRSRALVRRVDHTPQGLTIRRSPARSLSPEGPYRHVAQTRDDLELALRQGSAGALSAASLTIVFTALLWAFILWWDPLLMGLTVGIPVTLISTILLYGVAMGVFNTKRIKIEGDTLTVYSAPLPGGRILRLAAASIEQVWVEHKIAGPSGPTPTDIWTINVKTSADEHRLPIFPDMPQQALWIEQQIEDCLGIVDVAMEGEIGPNERALFSGPETQDAPAAAEPE